MTSPTKQIRRLATTAESTRVARDALREPVRLDVLKHKPGRRCTWRAVGTARTAIVKAYASDRAVVVARRIGALTSGPQEPLVPSVLAVDELRRVVVLTDVPGTPLTDSVLAGDLVASRDAGRALAAWHRWWSDRPPPGLAPHTATMELETLERQSGRLPASTARSLLAVASDLAVPWPCTGVVHRDLYEEQIMVGRSVGLIDLDDAAAGPPELDIGNLLAHLDLLDRRSGRSAVRRAATELVEAYRSTAELDTDRLERCRRLTLLRLSCIHDEPGLRRFAER